MLSTSVKISPGCSTKLATTNPSIILASKGDTLMLIASPLTRKIDPIIVPSIAFPRDIKGISFRRHTPNVPPIDIDISMEKMGESRKLYQVIAS